MRIGVVTVAGDIFPSIRMKYLIEKEHDVFYIGILPSINNPNFKVDGFEYITVGQDLNGFRILNRFDVAFQVRRLCKKLKLDVLHIIDMAYCLCAPFSGAKITVIENNGSDVLIIPQDRRYLSHLYRFCYRYTNGIIQDSYVAQKAAIKLGAKTSNNEIMELGTDFNLFNLKINKGQMRKRYNINPSQKIIFSPRSFGALYNIDVIIRSIPLVKEKYNDVAYVFCGYDLAMELQLRVLAESLGIGGNIIFAGVLDRKNELPYFYADADIVVSVPSSDSMPASVIEAMACGAKVIISELPWYRHKFERNVDLVTVPVRDHAALAEAVTHLLEGNPEIDPVSVYEKVKGHSDINAIGQRLESFYEQLLKYQSL